ncbi:MAG TPA: hypothetical protein VKP30_01670, partial [Polyangiaceae bacterium]|nr:hypothetical protein [Polyangiaceae bacterium]
KWSSSIELPDVPVRVVAIAIAFAHHSTGTPNVTTTNSEVQKGDIFFMAVFLVSEHATLRDALFWKGLRPQGITGGVYRANNAERQKG